MTNMLKPESSVAEANWTPKSPGQFGLALPASLSPPEDAYTALIQAEGGDVRYRDDGTEPSATTGMLIKDGGSVFYNGDLSAIQFAGAGTINVLYYGWAI